MVKADSRLDRGLKGLSGLEPVREPSPRYDLYAVDLESLGRRKSGGG